MGKFSFINLLSEGNTSDDFHKERKLEAEHTSFKRRRIAESEIVKPVSRFTFADLLKSQNVELTEPAEEIDNVDYNEIDDLDDNEIDNTDYNEIDDLDDNEIDNVDYNEIDNLDDNEDDLDN